MNASGDMSGGMEGPSGPNGPRDSQPVPGRRPLPPHVERVVAFFESISPADVARIGELYAADARFKDPFNDVRGTGPIATIFAHMFRQVDRPGFVVRDVLVDGDAALLTWDFEFGFRRPLPGGRQLIHGCTHLRFGADGRIVLHRDYWDAAEELYEKIPVLGGLMRLLRRSAGGG
jgi:steroid Delta-isomerase